MSAPTMTGSRATWAHDTLAQRVLFGSGRVAAHLAQEVTRLGASRVMLIAVEGQVGQARRAAAGIEVAVVHQDVAQHVPLECAQRARTVAVDNDIDLLVSFGGGSATGLAKAVALTTGLPVLAIPTTYAGSEATNVWGLTENATKTTGVDDRVLPRTVIYDAELSATMPQGLAVASGLNALAHCVDSLWAPRADPINAAFATEGIRALHDGLTALVAAPADLAGPEQALYGAYLSALAFASAGSGLHHKICHVLGGAHNLPHAETHAIVLPHVLAFNAPAAPQAAARIAAAFDAPSASQGLQRLRERIGAPSALKDHGLRQQDLPDLAQRILPAVPTSNPRPVSAADLLHILQAAHEGATPGA